MIVAVYSGFLFEKKTLESLKSSNDINKKLYKQAKIFCVF